MQPQNEGARADRHPHRAPKTCHTTKSDGGKNRRARWTSARPKQPKTIDQMRLAEGCRIIRHRHGGVVPACDDASIYLEFAVRHMPVAGPMSLSMRAASWSSLWTPSLSPDEVSAVVRDVQARPRRMNADAAARALGVTYAERETLKLRTIGARDLDRAARQAAAKERKRAKDRARDQQKRRAAGQVSREEYLASVKGREPWKELGLSRRSAYRKYGTVEAMLVALGPSRIEEEIRARNLVPTSEPPRRAPEGAPVRPILKVRVRTPDGFLIRPFIIGRTPFRIRPPAREGMASP